MTPQDLLVSKRGPSTSPVAGPVPRPETASKNPAGLRPARPSFDSAMRLALDRKPDGPRDPDSEQVGRRGRETAWEPANAPAADAGTISDEAATDETAIADEEREASREISNIILFPDPSVIIPFPLALVSGGPAGCQAFSACAGAQPGSGNAPVEDGAAGDGSSGENIVPLPTAPRTTAAAPVEAAESDLQSIGDAKRAGNDDDEDGIDVLKLGLRPTRREDTIEVVNFKQTGPGDAGKSKVEVPESDAGLRTQDVGRDIQDLPTQLPGETADPENSARVIESIHSDAKSSPSGPSRGKGPASTALAGSESNTGRSGAGSAEPAGIGAARQESRMNTLMDARHAPAEDELRLLGSADAGRGEDVLEDFLNAPAPPSRDGIISPDFSSRTPGTDWETRVQSPKFGLGLRTQDSASITVDRIANLVVREAAIVRQYKSDAMAVVLRPDADTELFVHFTQRNGQIEATIRCERGDAGQLGALWSQLQESLGQQKVRLGPLQESPSAGAPSNPSNFNSPAGSQTGNGSNGSPRQSPDQQSMDEWSAPAGSATHSRQDLTARERGREGSGHRRLTTSRPGWETWA
jgi:hypothetical protein